MKKFSTLLIIALLSLIDFTATAQNGWSVINAPYTSNYKDIFFTSASTGYAAGGNAANGVILKTTDGGNTWVSTILSGTNLKSIWFVDANNGYAVGTNGKMYKTTNAGSSWSLVSISTTANLKSVCFPASGTGTTGYVSTDTNIYKTINGSTSWTSISLPSVGMSTIANGVYFSSASQGVVYGNYNFINGWIARTSNGGNSWGTAYTTPASINDVMFPTASVGYAVGKAGWIYKTTDGGSSWISLSSGVISDLNGVFFYDVNNGFAVGDSGVVLRTTNGGTTWTKQITNLATTALHSIFAATNSVAYIAGDNSKILKTTSAGVTLSLNAPDDSVYCNGYTNLHAHVTYDGSSTLSFNWSPSTGLSSTTDSIVTAGPLSSPMTYIVTVTAGSLTATDTVQVDVVPLPVDSICIVAVDSITNHPIVVFEKHISGPIDYYKIYRESNIAGIWDSIGYVSADSGGVFIDTNANVIIRQYSYKISNMDSCGNESLLSAAHKTMHLQINAGSGGVWNLIWTPYEGINVQSYEIWRGADTLNMVKIGTVPGSNTSYTDLNPPSGLLYYLVRIVSPYVCQPDNFKTKRNYHTTRSNRANNGGNANPTLSADFSANPLNGNSPLNVQFTDNSNGIPTSWYWEFGDGDTSHIQNPAHTYTSDGKYSVKLVISNGTDSDSIIKTDLITVGPVGFEDIDLDKDLKIYPNPVKQNQQLIIEYTKVKIDDVRMVNIVGKELTIDMNRSNGHIEINTTNLSGGVYILKLQSSNGDVLIRKIVIQ